MDKCTLNELIETLTKLRDENHFSVNEDSVVKIRPKYTGTATWENDYTFDQCQVAVMEPEGEESNVTILF